MAVCEYQPSFNWERGATFSWRRGSECLMPASLPIQCLPRDEVDSSILLLGSFRNSFSSPKVPPEDSQEHKVLPPTPQGQIVWFVINLSLFYFWQILNPMLGYLIIWELTWCQQGRNLGYLALGSTSEDRVTVSVVCLSVTSSWELPSTVILKSGRECSNLWHIIITCFSQAAFMPSFSQPYIVLSSIN